MKFTSGGPFPAGGAVQALQREAQQRQQQRALQFLDLPSDGRARQKRTQLPSTQQRAKERKRDLVSYNDQLPGPSTTEMANGELYKRPRSFPYGKAEHPYAHRYVIRHQLQASSICLELVRSPKLADDWS